MSGCWWCEARGRCDQPPAAVFTGGCVHEHVQQVPVCADHLAQAQGLSARSLYCRLCRDAGEHGHFCVVTLTGVRHLESPAPAAAGGTG